MLRGDQIEGFALGGNLAKSCQIRATEQRIRGSGIAKTQGEGYIKSILTYLD